MIIGFTGTREGMTDDQDRRLGGIILKLKDVTEAHHGDCIGGDAEFHEICQFFKIPIIIHPPTNDKLRAFCKGAARVEEPQPYLTRNIIIVNTCDLLLAAPKEDSEPLPSRGQGTWSTIRYARKADCLLRIVWP
jgi:hypothetical protein